MTHPESIVLPTFSFTVGIGTLDVPSPSNDEFHWDAADTPNLLQHVVDSISVVSVEALLPMNEADFNMAFENGNDDDDVEVDDDHHDLLSWMASPDFGAAAADGGEGTPAEVGEVMDAPNQPPPQAQLQLSDIQAPQETDVRFGRGPEANRHPGNMWFLERVEERKVAYRASNTAGKSQIAQEVVQMVRNRTPPGRFLVRDRDTGLWNDVGVTEADRKAKQALREPPRHVRHGGAEGVVDNPVDPAVEAIVEAAEEADPNQHRGLPLDDYQPVFAIHPHDFLLGRGGSSNRQPGNHRLRDRAALNRPTYQAMRHSQKAYFANEILQAWRNETPSRPGRFLKRIDGMLYEVPEAEAIRTIQVLLCREPQPTQRRLSLPPPRVLHLEEPPLPQPPPAAHAAAPRAAASHIDGSLSPFAAAARPAYMSCRRQSSLRLPKIFGQGSDEPRGSRRRFADDAPSWITSSSAGTADATETSSGIGIGREPTCLDYAQGDKSNKAVKGGSVSRLTGRLKTLVQRLFRRSLFRAET